MRLLGRGNEEKERDAKRQARHARDRWLAKINPLLLEKGVFLMPLPDVECTYTLLLFDQHGGLLDQVKFRIQAGGTVEQPEWVIDFNAEHSHVSLDDCYLQLVPHGRTNEPAVWEYKFLAGTFNLLRARVSNPDRLQANSKAFLRIVAPTSNFRMKTTNQGTGCPQVRSQVVVTLSAKWRNPCRAICETKRVPSSLLPCRCSFRLFVERSPLFCFVFANPDSPLTQSTMNSLHNCAPIRRRNIKFFHDSSQPPGPHTCR